MAFPFFLMQQNLYFREFAVSWASFSSNASEILLKQPTQQSFLKYSVILQENKSASLFLTLLIKNCFGGLLEGNKFTFKINLKLVQKTHFNSLLLKVVSLKKKENLFDFISCK